MKRLGGTGVKLSTLMKSLIIALVTLTAGAGVGRAELFSPNVVPGAILGGVAGAVIGNNSGHHGSDGAIIGAVAGGLIGAAIDQDRSDTRYYSETRYYSAPPAPPVCEPREVYVQSAPRVVCASAPRVVYVEPRREVIIRRDDCRADYGRYDRYHYADRRHDDHRSYDRRYDDRRR